MRKKNRIKKRIDGNVTRGEKVTLSQKNYPFYNEPRK